MTEIPGSAGGSPASTNERIALVGAGLVGSLLAIFLARRGYKIDIFERRMDMRVEEISAGRSINLAISTRGIRALERLGIDDEILASAVPMRGRMIHSIEGELSFQPYGMNDRECINSISRATLNKALMTHAENAGDVKIYFNKKACGLDSSAVELSLIDEFTKDVESFKYQQIIGTDGSASAIRHELLTMDEYECDEVALEYGYKELLILPGADGEFKLEKNALHIWPRGNFMLIALPNFEGSFTCTLFLPFEGEVSFEYLHDDESIEAFFNVYFPDAVPLLDDLCETFRSNPTGHMVTVKTKPWHFDGRVLLVGDAAHGIVPFFGQGMNCGFEDCTIFDQLMEEQSKPEDPKPAGSRRSQALEESTTRDVSDPKKAGADNLDWKKLFNEFFQARKVNTDAIADMAVENFVEMRDKVGDKHFLMQKAVEKVLQREFPGRYVSRYGLVTFSNIPYKVALDVGVVDEEILSELCTGLNDPEQVDLTLAEKLIDAKLKPLLAPYTGQLQAASSH